MKTACRWFYLLLVLIPVAYGSEFVPEAKILSYQPERFGDYEVHYSAFNSTFVPPEVAKLYDLKRDGRYGVVNIAVRNVKDSDTGKAVISDVKGFHKNLLTQKTMLEFREVKEGDAIYYLAGFKFSGEERLKFTVDVKPANSSKAETIQFEQTFYEQSFYEK